VLGFQVYWAGPDLVLQVKCWNFVLRLLRIKVFVISSEANKCLMLGALPALELFIRLPWLLRKLSSHISLCEPLVIELYHIIVVVFTSRTKVELKLFSFTIIVGRINYFAIVISVDCLSSIMDVDAILGDRIVFAVAPVII